MWTQSVWDFFLHLMVHGLLFNKVILLNYNHYFIENMIDGNQNPTSKSVKDDSKSVQLWILKPSFIKH